MNGRLSFSSYSRACFVTLFVFHTPFNQRNVYSGTIFVIGQDIKHPSGINPAWDGTSPLSSPTSSSSSLHDLVSFVLMYCRSLHKHYFSKWGTCNSKKQSTCVLYAGGKINLYTKCARVPYFMIKPTWLVLTNLQCLL